MLWDHHFLFRRYHALLPAAGVQAIHVAYTCCVIQLPLSVPGGHSTTSIRQRFKIAQCVRSALVLKYHHHLIKYCMVVNFCVRLEEALLHPTGCRHRCMKLFSSARCCCPLRLLRAAFAHYPHLIWLFSTYRWVASSIHFSPSSRKEEGGGRR